jgi:hypothetical protein
MLIIQLVDDQPEDMVENKINVVSVLTELIV